MNVYRPSSTAGYLTRHYGPVYIQESSRSRTVSCGVFRWDEEYTAYISEGSNLRWSVIVGDEYHTPSGPEPETPTPPPSDPEPEACPAEPRCDHLAIVPGMPRTLGGEGPDHWLRITNPGATNLRFTIQGRDRAGTKSGTYRRELPAYRSVRVMMRDIEAAFDVTDPEGWWWMRVSATGPIDVVATWKQGEARRALPVERPATCGTGPVTRAGAGG